VGEVVVAFPPKSLYTIGMKNKNTAKRNELKKQIKAIQHMIEHDSKVLSGVHYQAWRESWTKMMLEMVAELEALS
jgi:hypothetical protein